MRQNRCLAVLVILAFCACYLQADSARCQSKENPAAKAQYKRLILDDGSYELITEYSIKGDRVRYFSAERYVWEELPYSMIDWKATEEYARKSAGDASGRITEARDEAAEEKREQDARMPMVAPALRLPSPDGVFLMDVYKDKPELNMLAQNDADLRKNTRDNILRGVVNPIAGSRQTMELKGLDARIHSHNPEPVLYFSVNAADPSTGFTVKSANDYLRLVRCENKKGNRVVATLEIAIYGKVKLQAKYVETRIESVSDYWVKIIPSAPLKTGEYALIEVDNKGVMNQFVWDFGVDPAAPPNPAILLAEPEKTEPVLIQKPRNKTNP
jgi:hypothetical protein